MFPAISAARAAEIQTSNCQFKKQSKWKERRAQCMRTVYSAPVAIEGFSQLQFTFEPGRGTYHAPGNLDTGIAVGQGLNGAVRLRGAIGPARRIHLEYDPGLVRS